MHNERVWNIKHGLVHHFLAAGPCHAKSVAWTNRPYSPYLQSMLKLVP